VYTVINIKVNGNKKASPGGKATINALYNYFQDKKYHFIFPIFLL
jgi:hypothetical protein